MLHSFPPVTLPSFWFLISNSIRLLCSNHCWGAKCYQEYRCGISPRFTCSLGHFLGPYLFMKLYFFSWPSTSRPLSRYFSTISKRTYYFFFNSLSPFSLASYCCYLIDHRPRSPNTGPKSTLMAFTKSSWLNLRTLLIKY